MNSKKLTTMALFLAILIIAGLFAIPVPMVGVPIILQNMVIMLCGGLLGKKYGTGVVAVFLFLAALGFPVLAGGQGGIAHFATPSGGFLLGYLISAFTIGLALEHIPPNKFLQTFFIYFIFGTLLINVFGAISIAYYGSISYLNALKMTLVFIPMDSLKAVIATLTTVKLYSTNVLPMKI